MASSASPARIIVLDGNPGFAGAAQRFIERLPGGAHAAGDIVLVDLGLGGLDLARRVKRSNPSLGVIALALFPTPELLAEAERAGIDAVVSKEAFAEELPGALARAGLGIAAAHAGAAQQALRESERRLSTLIASLPGVAYRRRNDENWTMEFVSEGTRALTGYMPEDFTSGRVSCGSLVQAQGYHFARPASAEQNIAWLAPACLAA